MYLLLIKLLYAMKKYFHSNERDCHVVIITITLYYFIIAFQMYSHLSLSQSRRDPLKHFEISVLRHITFAELRKIQSNNQISQINM